MIYFQLRDLSNKERHCFSFIHFILQGFHYEHYAAR